MNYDIHISSMVVPVKYTQYTSQEVLVGNKRKGVCGGEGGGGRVLYVRLFILSTNMYLNRPGLNVSGRTLHLQKGIME